MSLTKQVSLSQAFPANDRHPLVPPPQHVYNVPMIQPSTHPQAPFCLASLVSMNGIATHPVTRAPDRPIHLSSPRSLTSLNSSSPRIPPTSQLSPSSPSTRHYHPSGCRYRPSPGRLQGFPSGLPAPILTHPVSSFGACFAGGASPLYFCHHLVAV